MTKIPRKVLEMRRKRPRFVRQESWRYVRLKEVWRKPKGIDGRMRLQRSGAPPLVKIGYRSPAKYRHLHPSGYREVLVYSVAELKKVNPEVEAVRIASGLGRRKRMAIYEAAREAGVKVLNPPAVRVGEGGGEG
ncbi:hypothetical protein HRbin01_01823 [archaeon HR01]|nr:hypothetical protein HRbin01_01823 [archaeon HR01]